MTTKTETRNDKLRAAHDKLQAAVAEIVSGDDWKRMLKVASKFHRYSFNNHLMIFLQRCRCRPDWQPGLVLDPFFAVVLSEPDADGSIRKG